MQRKARTQGEAVFARGAVLHVDLGPPRCVTLRADASPLMAAHPPISPSPSGCLLLLSLFSWHGAQFFPEASSSSLPPGFPLCSHYLRSEKRSSQGHRRRLLPPGPSPVPITSQPRGLLALLQLGT